MLGIYVFQYIQLRTVEQKSSEAIESAQREINQVKEQAQKDIADEKRTVQTLIKKSEDKPSTSDIVSKWDPIVAYIVCEFKYTDGSVYQVQSGSGTLVIDSNGHRSVLTNEHVVDDGSGYRPSECAIKFPDDPTTMSVTYSDIMTSSSGSDEATILLANPDSYTKNLTAAGRHYCSAEPDIGDQIVILGYPGIGSPTGITATEGIVSGFDGDYYVTSAKVEHGNSGGAAISVKNNCYLGIPTYVETGQAESLARILKWQAF
ncbi:MAG TPA: trypsin-like peptidase domain-containing protein [Candidatus Paceibacterota bacterium]|nr:trypsin-like peptidase domain-containing protein [Candidatus Paceibacterota bacterium]